MRRNLLIHPFINEAFTDELPMSNPNKYMFYMFKVYSIKLLVISFLERKNFSNDCCFVLNCRTVLFWYVRQI